MAITLLQVVDSHKFSSYLKTTKLWRNFNSIMLVLAEVIGDLSGIDHDVSKSCSIKAITTTLVSKLKTAPFNKKAWPLFRETCQVWLATTLVNKDSCKERAEHGEEVQEVQEQQQEQEQEQGQDDVFGYGDGEKETNENNEPPTKKARKLLEPRKNKKTYSESGERWKRNVLKEEIDRLEAKEDEKLLADLMVKLQKRCKRKSQEQEEEQPTQDYFDEYLSCFNFICDGGISMNTWDKMVKWLPDFAKRGGNPLKLPCRKTLATYRDIMVPPGLEVTATSARYPLQNVLNHTAERLAKRPDLVDFFDYLEDGATLDLLWKWGMDGQTGGDSYSVLLILNYF